MTDSLPEISRLKALLNWLDREGKPSGRPAIIQIAKWHGDRTGIEDLFVAHADLVALVSSLPDLVSEQFGEDGRRATAMAIIQRVQNILSPQNVHAPMESFLAVTNADRIFVNATLPLLEDIKFGGDALSQSAPSIIEFVGKFRSDIQRLDGLSHASMVIVDAQLAALERSILKFSSGTVGKFRSEIFTSIGKIIVELKTNDQNTDVAVSDVIDGVMKVYRLFEVGGSLLQIGAPIISGLLPAPSAGA